MVAAELPPRKDWSMGASVATMPRATTGNGRAVKCGALQRPWARPDQMDSFDR